MSQVLKIKQKLNKTIIKYISKHSNINYIVGEIFAHAIIRFRRVFFGKHECNYLLVDISLNLEIECSKNLKATHYFHKSSKTPTINKGITFEHIQVPRAKGIDQIKSRCYLVVCQLSRDVIGSEDSKCHWCLSIRLLPVYCFVRQKRGSIGAL